MWENKDGKTPEQWDEEMEAENKKKFNENIFDIGPALALLIGTVYWSDWKFEQNSHAHRD